MGKASCGSGVPAVSTFALHGPMTLIYTWLSATFVVIGLQLSGCDESKTVPPPNPAVQPPSRELDVTDQRAVTQPSPGLAKAPWEDLLRTRRRNIEASYSNDYSGFGIRFPLEKKWSFRDHGETRTYRYDKRMVSEFVHEISYLGCDEQAVYVTGTNGRVYKLDIGTGRLEWETELGGGVPRGMLLGPYIVLQIGRRLPPQVNKDKSPNRFVVLATTTGRPVQTIVQKTRKWNETPPDERTKIVKLLEERRMIHEGRVGKSWDDIEAGPEYIKRLNEWRSKRHELPSVSSDPTTWDAALVASLFEEPLLGRQVDEDGSFYRTLWPKGETPVVVKYSSDGTVSWKRSVQRPRYISAVGEDDLIVMEMDEVVHRLSKQDGSTLWSRRVYPDSRHGDQVLRAFIFGQFIALSANNFGERELDRDKPYERTLLWLDRKTGERVHYTRLEDTRGEIIPAPGHIFAIVPQGTLVCYAFDN